MNVRELVFSSSELAGAPKEELVDWRSFNTSKTEISRDDDDYDDIFPAVAARLCPSREASLSPLVFYLQFYRRRPLLVPSGLVAAPRAVHQDEDIRGE